jgi:quinol monooxygenase YgiN
MVVHGEVKEGMMDALKDVGGRMVAAAETEEGAATYKWHISDDGPFISEDAYTDEAAVFAHVGAATESGMLDEYMGSMDWPESGCSIRSMTRRRRPRPGAVHYSMVIGF